MENKTDQHENQATELRKLLDEVQQGEKEVQEQQITEAEAESEAEMEQVRDIDILNLPPRKEVHGKMLKRTHIKISIPLLRLLFVIILLLGIGVGAYYFYGEEMIDMFSNI
ncbi:hypothetical protein CIL05_11700 [Virgibacillus profundi]|uniref:Uncharacterized protein n=1 Tax=Virgibacillus profundi TaxID=2024555 RepID=A0A2A2ID67_9BACI|nr:hypothetical protein [Virgibacillus profundi]PAV29522.1 hypothetical protein CIL05_11700 [Virgibacillus profundi]PXY53692.1 hypothetical protein CIT14_11815 [Virgibacillus profundi]